MLAEIARQRARERERLSMALSNHRTIQIGEVVGNTTHAWYILLDA